MTGNPTPWTWCPRCQKRGYSSVHDAAKALGRAQTRRNRSADQYPTRRGQLRENRYYQCPEGHYHLTSQSRRHYTELRHARMGGESD